MRVGAISATFLCALGAKIGSKLQNATQAMHELHIAIIDTATSDWSTQPRNLFFCHYFKYLYFLPPFHSDCGMLSALLTHGANDADCNTHMERKHFPGV
jgi:hypothetical protein